LFYFLVYNRRCPFSRAAPVFTVYLFLSFNLLFLWKMRRIGRRWIERGSAASARSGSGAAGRLASGL